MTLRIDLCLIGASSSSNVVIINDGSSTKLQPCSLRWVQNADENDSSSVKIPVYLDAERAELLFVINVKANVARSVLAQRGVAVIV